MKFNSIYLSESVNLPKWVIIASSFCRHLLHFTSFCRIFADFYRHLSRQILSLIFIWNLIRQILSLIFIWNLIRQSKWVVNLIARIPIIFLQEFLCKKTSKIFRGTYCLSRKNPIYFSYNFLFFHKENWDELDLFCTCMTVMCIFMCNSLHKPIY